MAPTAPETRRVLVVDDDSANAQALADVIAEFTGCTTSVVGSGAEALAAIEKPPHPDAVLLDVEMHGMSGIEVLRALRIRWSPLALPVIMVTAHESGREVVEALQAGANDYLTKPVDIQVLLARLQTHLRLAELARLKDDVLRMASHDLKNPLTAVLMNAQLILEAPPGTPVGAELHASARSILSRARYMQRLINEFLDQQAARDGQLQLDVAQVALDRLAAEIAEEQQDYAHARGLTLEAQGEPLVAPADAARLTQVLHNLIGNAVKFTPRGGRVRVLTRRANRHAIVEVCDDGPGLGDDPERLFEAGARGPAQPTGGERSTGLGLYLSRLLVEKHGGTLRAENLPGRGACFRMELPLSAP
jgi:signal transduction histidine kinase